MAEEWDSRLPQLGGNQRLTRTALLQQQCSVRHAGPAFNHVLISPLFSLFWKEFYCDMEMVRHDCICTDINTVE
jgi:hypothetical protein